MRKILMTTAILTSLAGAVSAQEILVPEGFSAFEDVGRLTFDDLNGQTVYDANGQSLGEISDIVFSAGAITDTEGADIQGDTAMDDADMSDDAAMDDMATDDADTEITDETALDMGEEIQDDVLAGDGDATEGVTETDAMQDGVDSVADPANTDPAGAADDMMATDDTMAADAVEAVDDVADDAADATADLADDMSDGTDGATTDVVEDMSSMEGRVSHVVIDIGGFLGIGAHTVAVPIGALEIYADGGNRLQLYLPWTEEQLRELQAYDENDPSTLGQMSEIGE